MKHHFPKTATPEFLLVDLVNNIDRLAEDNQSILDNTLEKAKQFDAAKLKHAVEELRNDKNTKIINVCTEWEYLSLRSINSPRVYGSRLILTKLGSNGAEIGTWIFVGNLY